MKKSNLTLLILLIAFFYILLMFGFRTPLQKENNRRLATPSWLEAKGAELADTIVGNYHHLVCGFPLTSLDARLENTLIVRGSKNAIPFSSARIKNDTLFLDYIDYDADYKVADSKVNGRYPIHLIVGSKGLKSVSVKRGGNIIVDARSIGLKNDIPVYDSIDHVKNFQSFGELEIVLYDNAKIDLYMNASTVKLRTDRFTGIYMLQGHIKNLNFHYPQGHLNGGSINVDSAFIYYNDDIENNNSGRLNLNCTKYLYAELHADMDIFYKGNPVIVKVETDYGRVINDNDKPQTEEHLAQANAQFIIKEHSNKDLMKYDSTRFITRRDSIHEIRNTPDQLIKIPS